MKKVYTITFHRALNHGAVLQCYALSKFLSKEGYDCEVVDYLPSYFAFQTYRPAKGIKKSIEKFKKIIKFHEFRKNHIKTTEKTYFSYKSLDKLPSAYAALCGSDQIWNKTLTGSAFDPAFFLGFLPKESKRIAYAASAGSIRLLEDKSKVIGFLDSFDSIGVREETLASDVSAISDGANPQVVVDPCLLIDDYGEIISNEHVPSHDYVVSYVVGSGDMLDVFNRRVMEFKNNSSLPIVHIGSKDISSADVSLLDIGPSDWVALIKNAKYVITNSFHGTAFSINFRKNFVFIPHVIENLNDRQRTLLNRVDLLDRMLLDSDSLDQINEIDYSKHSERIEAVIKESKKFLLDSLG